MTYRVVQWATGAIGKTTLRAVLDRPDLELAGVYVYSSRKDGMDAGEIARRPPVGVRATRSIDDVIDLRPDVVLHTARLQLPYEKHDADVVRLLEAGINVITTAGNHHPAAHGAARAALFDAAGRAGGATLYGVGMNPGYLLERLVLGLTGVCTEVESIEVEEALDASTMPDPDFVFTVMGMGSSPEAIDLVSGPLARLFGMLYREPMVFLAERMNVPIDEVRPDHEIVVTEHDLAVRAGVITAGTVAATEWRWHLISAGRRFLTLSIVWTMDPSLPRYRGRPHWDVRITGRPMLSLQLDMAEPPGMDTATKAGQFITAGPVVNAIPDVVAAPPGIFLPPVFAPWQRPVTAVAAAAGQPR